MNSKSERMNQIMVVSSNIPALNTSLSMRRADRGLQTAMRRLSTGMRINSARDDAAGLSVANKLSYQVGALNRASENATHGTSLIQTAEGAMNEIHAMLQRMRELAVQAANDTLTSGNRAVIQMEIDQLIDEIHQISRRTEFNRMRILNGEADRIIENFSVDAVTGLNLTRSVVTPTFVSPNVSPGVLSYYIVEAGTHAVAEFLTGFPTSGPVPQGRISINGVWMDVPVGMSISEFSTLFNQTLEYAGVKRVSDINGEFLVSVIAGSDQRVELSGTGAILNFLNLSTTFARGTDARLDITGMVDINGNPIPIDTWAQSARGNQVTIVSSTGEEIRLNIQVMFDAETSGHIFGDREPIPVPNSPRSMEMNIRNFGPIMLQIGPGHNMAMPVQIPRINAETLGLAEFVGGQKRIMVNYRNRQGASDAIDVADRAIRMVSNTRARLGAYQNRLESTIRNLDVAAENTEMSRSRVQDSDIARESTNFATYNVMLQAAQAILSQANQRPQMLVSLLQ